MKDKLSFGSHRKSAEKQTYGLFTELNPSNVLQNFSYLPLFIVSHHWHYVLRTRTEYSHQKNGDYDSLYEDIMRSL